MNRNRDLYLDMASTYHAESGQLVDVEEIERAQVRVATVCVETPLLPSQLMESRRLMLKLECLQATGSFKIRGAWNALQMMTEGGCKLEGVVAHSSGNHGIAVAYAARAVGIPATIVVPRDISKVKARRIRELGATLVLTNPSSTQRADRAGEIAQRDGFSLIPSANDRHVIAGQGTVGREIVDELAGQNTLMAKGVTILVPIGGGGLASGIVVVAKALCPEAQVLGVEPALASDAAASLLHGRLITFPADRVAQTIADGLRLMRLAPLAFEHLRRFLDGVILVEEDEIRSAVSALRTHHGLIVEPSGAVTVAAALFHDEVLPRGGTVVCVLTGRNADE